MVQFLENSDAHYQGLDKTKNIAVVKLKINFAATILKSN